jgi:hypothetical protein
MICIVPHCASIAATACLWKVSYFDHRQDTGLLVPPLLDAPPWDGFNAIRHRDALPTAITRRRVGRRVNALGPVPLSQVHAQHAGAGKHYRYENEATSRATGPVLHAVDVEYDHLALD